MAEMQILSGNKNEAEVIQQTSREQFSEVTGAPSGTEAMESKSLGDRSMNHLPPDEDSPFNILNKLNDDCFLEIFQCLSPRSLCAVAKVCTRFKSNAEKIFTNRFADLHITPFINLDGEAGIRIRWNKNDVFYRDDSMSLITSIFQHFCRYIQAIHLQGNQCSPKQYACILFLLVKFCSMENGSIAKLYLEQCPLNDTFVQILKPLLARLKSLTICSSSSSFGRPTVHYMLSFCRELMELSLINPLIESTSFFCHGISPLEAIEQIETYSNVDRSSIFRSIGTYLSKLERLEVENVGESSEHSQEDIICLAQLKHLKVLTAKCISVSAEYILNVLVEGMMPTEDLTLKYFALDSKRMDYLVKLNQVKKLTLIDGCIDLNQLDRLIRENRHLIEISLRNFHETDFQTFKEDDNLDDMINILLFYEIHETQSYMEINEDRFKLIANMVRDRDGSKLMLGFRNAYYKLIVPIEILNTYRPWLEIDISDIGKPDDGRSAYFNKIELAFMDIKYSD